MFEEEVKKILDRLQIKDKSELNVAVWGAIKDLECQKKIEEIISDTERMIPPVNSEYKTAWQVIKSKYSRR